MWEEPLQLHTFHQIGRRYPQCGRGQLSNAFDASGLAVDNRNMGGVAKARDDVSIKARS